MNHDHTEQQTDEARRQAQRMSAQRTVPPTQVPGYEIQRFLGAGAYGEVWVGIDRNTGRKVAIKFFTGRSRVDMALLSREVEKLVFLSADRYVVQLLDVGWDSTPPYYVMDYIEQGSLEDYLLNNGALSVADATDLFREIAIGLSHLHNRGVLHCDLKPANVLLDEDQKPRLADFGQARLASEQNPALGTMFFMAPEQADLEAIPDTRWDVYSLGAIMYCMLVGEPPYRSDFALSEVRSGETLADRLAKYRRVIAQSERPQTHRRLPGVDRGLADLVDRCLAADPSDRFDSVQSVLIALEQHEEAQSRRPILWLGLVGPVALLLIMVLFSWGLYQNSVGRTDAGLKMKSQESNGWAAQFAARSAAERIDMFFETVSRLAEEQELVEELSRLATDNDEIQELAEILDDPANNESRSDAVHETRQQFVDHPDRQPLQQWVGQLLERSDLPEVASWFVCNPRGLQVAAAFPQEGVQPTIGKCFAYRTYFSGAPNDLVRFESGRTVYEVAPPGENRLHIEGPHLSAVFASQATGTWKIAFSMPIRRGDQFLGILAATVDMGNFMEFSDQASQFVMLVDGREGRNRGAILEHPLFDEYRQAQKLLPVEFRQVRIPEEVLLQEYSELTDPLGDHPEGKEFNRVWLAARRPVQRKVEPRDHQDEPERVATGLWVLALEDADSILQPAHELSRSFIQLGAIAVTFALCIMLGMWLMVIRTWRQSRARLNQVLLSHGSDRLSASPPTPATIAAKSEGTEVAQPKND